MKKKNRKWIFQLCIITMIGLILRIIGLFNLPINFDEAHNILLTKTDDLVLMIKASAHAYPPLFFIVWHYWQMLSNNFIFLRLPSLVFGTATIIAIGLVAKKIFNKKAGLLIAFMVAVSPSQIYYSSIARMYSLSIFESTLLVYFFLKLLTKRSGLLPLGVLMLAGLYTHFFFILLILMLNFWIVINWQNTKSILLGWLILNMLIVALYIPIIILLLTVDHAVAVPTFSLYKIPLFWVVPILPWDTFQSLQIVRFGTLDLSSILALGLLALTIIMLAGTLGVLKKNKIMFSLILIYFITPIFITAVSIKFAIAAVRSFVIFSPLFFLIIAGLLALNSKKRYILLIFSIVIPTSLLFLVSDLQRASKDEMRQVYKYFRTDDVIVYNDPVLFFPTRVIKTPGKHFLIYPGYLPKINYQALNISITKIDDLPKNKRLWYVRQKTGYPPYESLAEKLENTLEKKFLKSRKKDYYSFQLILYHSKDGL